jgi:hypothetical protein
MDLKRSGAKFYGATETKSFIISLDLKQFVKYAMKVGNPQGIGLMLWCQRQV